MADAGKIRLEIITPYGVFYDGVVDSVTVRVKDGEMGIMHMHTPMVAALVPGETRMLEDGVWKHCATTNGYAEIGHDLVIVVVSAAEWPDDINVPRSEEALRRARERYAANRSHPVLATRDRHAIERAKARLDVARKFAKKADRPGGRPVNPL
ncbi:MAG: ATP synthase F1 subunit epsilon [Clostridia bacterium]|nr:ATP synthase F1 subunit epsilon [Clostridia bacterium]